MTSIYAYADGDPISKKDPLGLDPWGGLNGGVTPEEAEAQAVEQWVNNLWNTPDPCVKAYFEQHYGPGWTRFIGFFSAYSLMSGPQNVAPGGPEGAWREVGESIAIKGPAGAVANRVFPNAAPVAGKVLGWTGSIASVIASAWDVIGTIRALDAEDPSGQCGCKRQ